MSCAFVSPRRCAACLPAICSRPDADPVCQSPGSGAPHLRGLLAHCKSLHAVWLGRVRWAGIRLCEACSPLHSAVVWTMTVVLCELPKRCQSCPLDCDDMIIKDHAGLVAAHSYTCDIGHGSATGRSRILVPNWIPFPSAVREHPQAAAPQSACAEALLYAGLLYAGLLYAHISAGCFSSVSIRPCPYT